MVTPVRDRPCFLPRAVLPREPQFSCEPVAQSVEHLTFDRERRPETAG